MSGIQEQAVGSSQEISPSPVQPSVPPDQTATPENVSSEAVATSTPVFVQPESTRPSALPKPSGLKPPTKIGRLCANSTPKPAVPLSPRGDGGSSDTVRKLSDELSRKHLSDLIEDEEDEVTSTLPERHRTYRKASTSSNFSGTSMDALWEKHPRRLSEAGLRRSSDHSVVLTEDTDSFIIGDRVWVGGTKPGQIAYIGETQFAPGDWAGIVLDEPIGKNDGSVAGVRYFQCSEKRGVFSRLTRLTRVPLLSHYGHDASPVSDGGSVFDRPPSGMSRARRTLSPNGSVRSAVSSKMNASISTAVTTPKGELCLGDRVIVSSSRGSKAGLLRYVGNTDFAPGLWAGVELDDPLGKNDGSVDGKRYFDCSPRFGLFAPLSKVTRSPSNRKPGQCAIHNNNGRITPLRRSNSRDSLTSLTTSIASSRVTGVRGGLGAQRLSGPRASSTPVSAKNAALQELLREKQSHLERLMKERDLERAEVAKITLQADRAENALSLAKKEADETINENAKLKAELERIQQRLEDERQKVEDLMFRNEEENINKEDYQKYKEAMEKEKEAYELKIRELEAEVELANARTQAAAAASIALDDQRASDINAITQQHREELTAAQTLSSELQKLLDEAYALLREKEYEKDSLNKSMSDELSKVRAESERALNEAKTKIAIAQTEFETQMSVLSGKLTLAESKLESEKANVERLNKENSQTVIELNARLSQLQAALDDKTHELNKVTGSSKEHELNLNKEITKLKMELSAKILDLENLSEQHNKQNTIFKTLEEELTRTKDEYKQKVDEYETILNEVSQQNDTSKTQIAELQQKLAAKTREYEKLLADNSTSTASTEKLLLEYKQTITERDKEIVKLKDEYEKATANFNINHSKIAEEHQKEIEERNVKIENLIKEMENYKSSLEQNTVDLEALRARFITSEDELKALKAENEDLKKSVAELTQTNSELKTKMSQMELEEGELKRLLEGSKEKCEELQKAKAKAEEEYLNLTGQTTNSNDQFNQLSQLLKTTEQELQDIKDKYRDAANTHGRTEQELKQQLFRLQEDYSLERTQLLKSADETIEKLKTTENKGFELQAQLNDFKKLAEESQRNSEKLTDESNSLRREIESLQTKESELIAQHEQICRRMETDIEKYKEEVSLLKAEGASSEVKLMEKVDQLIEAQNDLNNKLEEARRHEDALQKVIDDMTATLNNQKSQYDNELLTLQTQLSGATEENSKIKSEENRIKELLQVKETNDKELQLKLEMLEVDMKSNVEVANEKDRQLAQLSTELDQNIEMKKQIEDKLNNALLEASKLRQQYDNLIANSSVEESLLKEQQTQLESVKKDITVVTQEKIAIESKCAEIFKELTELKEEYQKTLQVLQEVQNSHKKLQTTLSEKDNLLKENAVVLETETAKLQNFDSLVNNLKQELTIKTSEFIAKETELKKIKELLETGSNESQQKVKELQEELNTINENHKHELESVHSQCKVLQSRVTEQENQLQDLEKSKAKICELQDRLAKSDNDIQQLSNINEGQKTNYEELNKQLQQQCDDYRRDCKKIKSEYKSRISDLEKETQSYKEKIQNELTNQEEMQKKLEAAENQSVELSNKLELLTVQNTANVGNDVKLEQLTLELQSLRKSNAETLQSSEAAINKLKLEVDSKVKELKDKENLLSKLQSELQNQRAKLEISEREKVLLQKDLSGRSKEVLLKDKNDNSTAGGHGDAVNRTEDAEIIEGQVSFLNSVIVDMQRKNEKLMARVQALEGGVEAPQLFNNGRKPRVVAPRLFCDICDVFDAHDTEDCPRQAQEDVQPAPKDGTRNPPPPPRSYCDICEVFGHSTENCDEEETF